MRLLVLFLLLMEPSALASRTSILSCFHKWGMVGGIAETRPVVVVEKKSGEFLVIQEQADGTLKTATVKDRKAASKAAEILQNDHTKGELKVSLAAKRLGDTTEMFTTRKLDPNTPDFKTLLAKAETWTPERHALHQEMLAHQYAQTQELSEALSQSELAQRYKGKPLLVMTRGNTASGKSTALKNGGSPLVKDLGADHFAQKLADGALNPDTLKNQLQHITPDLNSYQVHEEGSMLTDLVIQRSFENKLNIVVDKRLGSASSVDALAKRAKDQGYAVVMVDVDADISDAGLRLLNRVPGGESPNVPFIALERGFQEARTARSEVAQSPWIDEYELISTSQKKPALVARRRAPAALEIKEAPLWTEVTSAYPERVESARNNLATAIDSLSSFDGPSYAAASDFANRLPENLPSSVPRSHSSLDYFAQLEEATQTPTRSFSETELHWERYGKPEGFVPTPRDYVELLRIQDRGIEMALKDSLYEVRRGGNPQDHWTLGSTLEKYFKSSFGYAKTVRQEAPFGYTIEVSGLTPGDLQRIASNSSWKVETDLSRNLIRISTDDQRLLKADWVDPEFILPPGLNHEHASAHPQLNPAQILQRAKNSLAFDNEVKGVPARGAKGPLLFDLQTLSPKMKFEFDRELEDRLFKYGFRSDESDNALKGAQSGLAAARNFAADAQKFPSAIRFQSYLDRVLQTTEDTARMSRTLAAQTEFVLQHIENNGYKMVSSLGNGATDFEFVGDPYFRIPFSSQQMKARFGDDWRKQLPDEIKRLRRQQDEIQSQATSVLGEIQKLRNGGG